MVFVPARFAAAAINEAIDAGCATVIAITEGIPVHDMLPTYWRAREQGVRLIGPNCPGVLSPGKANVGSSRRSSSIAARSASSRAPARSPTRSATSSSRRGLGNSTIVGIGGDPIVGLRLHRRPRAVRERPGDRADRDGRRDRRRRRGAGRRLHRRERDQAGGRLHRRLHRSSRQADGPRRARSSPAPPAPPQAKQDALEAKGVRVGTSPTEAAAIAAEIAGS